MVKESWFVETLAAKEPVDLFVLLGHNPVRPSSPASTFRTVLDAIRAAHPRTPVQIFGGHTHVRDFAVYDDATVGIESGRYCETLGWLSMSGFDSSNSGYRGAPQPRGAARAWRPARKGSRSPFVYSRRYLDWNRKTFVYHSGDDGETHDDASGRRVTGDITRVHDELSLGHVYGCAPRDWCKSCAPFDDARNIFPGVVYPAAAAVVVNEERADRARIILGNTGAIRFDLHKGPFTYDDSFITSPFRNAFLYVPDVPFARASRLIQQ